MKWLLVAEGPHEVAQFNERYRFDPATGEEQYGALRALIERILDGKVALPPPEIRRISDVNVATIRGRGKGYLPRLMAWLRWAERENRFDFVVIVFDEDNVLERRKAAENAQENLVQAAIPRAIGVAIRTFDAWMLADQKALQSVLGTNVDFISRPEDEEDPKSCCKQLARTAGYEGATRDLYLKLITDHNLSIETLEKLCPKGFQPFAERVRKLFSTAS